MKALFQLVSVKMLSSIHALYINSIFLPAGNTLCSFSFCVNFCAKQLKYLSTMGDIITMNMDNVDYLGQSHLQYPAAMNTN